MKKTKTMFAMVLASMVGSAGMVSASVIVSTTTDLSGWGGAFSTIATPDGETFARDLKQGRDMYQSFRLTSDVNDITEVQIAGIFLSNDPAATFDVNFYSVTDSTAADYVSTVGASLKTISVANTTSPGDTSGFGYVSLALDGGDIFSLAAGDYAVRITASSAANAWVKWDAENSNGSNYTEGFAYFADSTGAQTLDMGVAVVPEPATIGLVSLMGGGILFIRQRFMI